MTRFRLTLPIIIISQFLCTSLWFAVNGVMNDLIINFNLSNSALGHLTSSVQFGFIIGTLIFAILTIADRYSPSKVFLISALLGSIFNLGILWNGNTLTSILLFRFLTGFFLAGIYPVGMKIAADYYEKGLGKALGFLVGALVLGTALPHLLKDISNMLPWKTVIITISFFASLGGVLIVTIVPDGPFRKASLKFNTSVFLKVFQNRKFRASAFGYFGHMWELYTFWTFVPIILKTYTIKYPQIYFNIPLLSFLIIGVGSLSCVIGGYFSQSFGVKKTASTFLLFSCICCLISPLVFIAGYEFLFIMFLIIWGMVVIADSPLFSTLIAQNAPLEIKGTALTIVNCIGFSITIISIQLINTIQILTNSDAIYMILALGPILGLIALRDKTSPNKT